MENLHLIIIAFFSGISIGYVLNTVLSGKKKEIKISYPGEIKLSSEETMQVDSRDTCIKCNGKVKGHFDEKKKHAVIVCSSCGCVYHQYHPYGSFYLQP